MLKHHRKYAWVTAIPALVVACITLTATTQTVFSMDKRVGSFGIAAAAREDIVKATPLLSAGGEVATKAQQTIQSANANLSNAWITGILTGILLVSVVLVLAISIKEAFKISSGAPEAERMKVSV